MKKVFGILVVLIIVSVLMFPINVVAMPKNMLDNGFWDDVEVVGYTMQGQPIYQKTFYSSSETEIVTASDGLLQVVDATYNTAWVATTATTINSLLSFSVVGQVSNAGLYGIYRSPLYFDTTGLSSDVTITATDLKLYGKDDLSTTDFNITIQNGQPTYPHDPLVAGDINKAYYSGSGGTFDTSGWSTAGYNTVNLDATGISWVNKEGVTKFMLRSSRDIAGTAPSGLEYVSFYSYEKGDGYRPQLVITFTLANPAITAVTASNIAKTTARLNSNITDDGGEVAGDTEVRFGYGTTSQDAVDFESYDTVTEWVSGYSENDNPYLDISSLTDDTTYYFRAQVKNSAATVTSANEITFDTLMAVGDVLVFNGFPNTTSISLNWAIPSGAGQVLIRYKTDTYPTATDDGTQVYLGGLSTKEHTSLVAGKTYYYSIWGESGGEYSTNAKNLALTTLGISGTTISGGDTLPTPGLPSGFFSPIDPTKLQKFEPLYSILNNFATSWGMPAATMWLIAFLLLIAVIGLVILVETQNLAAALIVCSIFMIGLTIMQLLPVYFVFIALAFDAGAWGLERTRG